MKERVWPALSLMTLLVGVGLAPAARAADPVPAPASTASHLTIEAISASLQSSGFQAKPFEGAPPNALGQIITGISGVNVLIVAFKCGNSSSICFLSLTSLFTDAVAIDDTALATLNAASFAKVAVQPVKDGKPGGFRVTYLYPCEGFDDPKFVPMVLKAFGGGLLAVTTAYQKLNLAATAASAGPPPYRDQQLLLWKDKPNYAALAGAQHVHSSTVITAAKPDYPRTARSNPVEAKVKVSYVVGPNGRVEDARVLESSDPRFNSSALDAVRKFTFDPAKGPSGAERDMAVLSFDFKPPL